MLRKLDSKDIVYNVNFDSEIYLNRESFIPEYKENVYEELDEALELNHQGYNIYLVDDLTSMKVEKLKEYLEKVMVNKEVPNDICYVIKEDREKPETLYLKKGNGEKLRNELEMIQKKYYDVIFDFYNLENCEEKENIIDSLQNYRTKLIEELVEKAHENGFDIKSSYKGFAFIPLTKEGEITEDDFELLKKEEKKDMLEKVDILKKEARDILDELKNKEIIELEKLKELLKVFLLEEMAEFKEELSLKFENDDSALNYIEYIYDNIEEELVEIYTMNFEEDDIQIKDILFNYEVNVMFDGSQIDSPRVIFENDPSLSNLFGNIEYTNKNGTYTSEISMITGGSVINSNGGVLIIEINKLLAYSKSYNYLKNFIEEGKLKLDYNKNYLELLTISSIKPEEIIVETKLILVGTIETYDLLYEYDPDFKKIFKLKVEYNPVVNCDEKNKETLKAALNNLCSEKKYKELSDSCYNKISKYLARKAENREKVLFDISTINDILILSDNKARKLNKKNIDEECLVFPDGKNSIIRKKIDEMYKNKHILVTVSGEKVGQVNGLSVIDLNYFVFGKPIKITCTCYKGEGHIIDVQKESELSGKIHSKAINTLSGLLNNLLNSYSRIPVDLHLSFEQIYGMVDGDSASVAEFLTIISSISKVPIKQNMGVTGSLNQFGEVQSIGGANEKIEGFYNTCQVIDSTKDKGVLIPNTNRNDLVLNDEIEKSILLNEFHIYTMENIKDAIEVMMGDYEEVLMKLRKELKKYSK